MSWENRLTGRKLNLRNGPEAEPEIGLPRQPRTTPTFRVTKLPAPALWLRPFEITLLEAVPLDEPPTLNRPFRQRPLPGKPAELAQPVSLAVELVAGSDRTLGTNHKREFVLRGTVPASQAGGVLTASIEFRQAGQPFWTFQGESGFSVVGTIAGQPATFQPAVRRGASYPCAWQTWRARVETSAVAQSVELRIRSSLPADVEQSFFGVLHPARCDTRLAATMTFGRDTIRDSAPGRSGASGWAAHR